MKYRTLLTVANPIKRRHWADRLEKLNRIDVAGVFDSLTEAYHSSEHCPPKLAIFSDNLTKLPEFEVLLFVLKSVNARVVVLEESSADNRKSNSVGSNEAVFINDLMSDDEIEAVLFSAKVQSSKPLQPQTASSPVASKITNGRIIMLGSSTGGVEALIKVLSNFKMDCPPTFLVQHTGGSFSSGLARLLDSKCAAKVCEAEDRMPVKPGMIVVAPGNTSHLKAELRRADLRCRLSVGPSVGGHRPAVDELFRSGVTFATKISAAILTGMGRDGADGLLALKKAGARTFGQDAETSLVYGMPRAAAELGAVERQLPISRIGPALISSCSERAIV